MGNWSYYSRDKLKLDLGETGTTDDDMFRRALEEASEQLDAYLGRTFRVVTATRYYTADSRRCLPVHDLLAVTTLKTLTANSGGTRTYGDTWAAVDYDLGPDNASTDREPYTEIRRNPEGAYSFPVTTRGVEIVGRWGYFQELAVVASLLAEALDTSETGVDVDAGTDFDVLDTILVDSEQMYVTAISTNTMTVVRGVNGTTAAAHDNDSAISRYKYPEVLASACRRQAGRLYQQAKAPSGMMGGGDPGQTRIRSDLDWDIRNSIDHLRYPGILAWA